MYPIDLYASLGLLGLLIAGAFSYAVRLKISGAAHFARVDVAGGSPLLGKSLLEMGYWCLQPLAQLCIRAGLSPNQLTGISLAFGLAAGVAVGFGHFGVSAVLAIISALGDALDGLIARATNNVSPGGALFDASVDRYGEFFFLAGFTLYERANTAMVALSLLTLLGSYMVSYGSAKAEWLGVKAPRGAMRRVERAVYLCAGSVLTPISASLAIAHGWSDWAAQAPMFAAIALVGVVANISAVRRLIAVGQAANLITPVRRVDVVPQRNLTVVPDVATPVDTPVLASPVVSIVPQSQSAVRPVAAARAR